MYTGTPVASKVLASSLVIMPDAFGMLFAASCTVDASAPSATYYVQLIDSPTPVDTGGVITPICAPIPVEHVSGVPDYVQFPLPPCGVSVRTGAVIQLSSTLTTGSLSGAYMLAGGSR